MFHSSRLMVALPLLISCSAAVSQVDASVEVDAGAFVVDGGSYDAQIPDAASDDAGSHDAGVSDAGLADAGADAGWVDAGGDAGSEALHVTVLQDVTDASVPYQLLRIERRGQATYAQWFPPPREAGDRPVVVLTEPYDGIDWTGEAVDERWAAGGAGLRPDVDSPAYDGGDIVYTPLPASQAFDVKTAFVYRFHNFGVLMVFGRFYAGGDVRNDIDDMTAGLEALTKLSQVDTSRIGIMGGSWGGFEALYGAAYASPAVRPSVGVALYPLSDFEDERQYATQVLPSRYVQSSSQAACAIFFDPYLRRLAATTARTGYDGLRKTDLLSRITMPFLLVHEDWDTLVSIEQSRALASASPNIFSVAWLQHAAPPSPWDITLNTHGRLLEDFGQKAMMTWTWAFLLLHLGDPAQQLFVPFDLQSTTAYASLVHQRQLEGLNENFYAERLLSLLDSRVVMYELTSKTTVSGVDFVVTLINSEWHRTETRDTIRATLTAGLP